MEIERNRAYVNRKEHNRIGNKTTYFLIDVVIYLYKWSSPTTNWQLIDSYPNYH